MCAVTHRAKPYQLALLIKKSLDDVIGTQQSVCEDTLQYQYYKMYFSLIHALFAESSIDILKKCVFYITYKLKLPLRVFFETSLSCFLKDFYDMI